ncbi:MAG TPA: cupin domain-containing protein [Acetobacteraceae bacterium]|nr:cupin domain-containing protein [Acetobacteraceae bacterium]
MDIEQLPEKREFREGYRWDGVEHMPYKQEGSAPFKDVSRQVLFQQPGMGCDLRYFEVGVGGYSTLEQHEHAHAVMILRGHGHCLLGSEVTEVKPFDLVTIPSWTWHQFRATQGEPLGFLCMVNQDRDRPRLPTPDDLAALRARPAVARFLDL